MLRVGYLGSVVMILFYAFTSVKIMIVGQLGPGLWTFAPYFSNCHEELYKN